MNCVSWDGFERLLFWGDRLFWRPFDARLKPMTAHVPTLLLMTILAAVVMAGALLLLGWGRRRDGLQHWATALLLAAAGYALFLLRGRIPDAFSIVLGNVLVAASFSFLLAAVRCFYALPMRWLAVLAPAVLIAPVVALAGHDFALRVSLASGVMLLQVVWLLWVLVQHRKDETGRGMQLLIVGIGLEALLLLARTFGGVLFLSEDSNFLHSNGLQTYSFMVAFLALLVTSMGFVFMGKDRSDAINHRLAAQDELTGLANRRSVIAALERDVARALRTQEPLAVMMMDVDHFKRVNDRWGHQAGDAVLRSVADVLRQRLRAQDIVGRYGGEEFLLVLPDTAFEGAHQVALHLCAAVQASPCIWGQHSIPVTVSVGVFSGPLAPGVQSDQLLQAADSALYRAKAAGRNRVAMACDPEPCSMPAPLDPQAPTTLPITP